MKGNSYKPNGSANMPAESNQDLRGNQKLLDFSPDVICALDKNGQFLYVSAAAKTNWGYEPAELIGSNLLDHVIPANKPQAGQMLEAARSGLFPSCFQNLLYCKEGKIILVQWSLQWNAKEEVLYCVARDSKELMAAEEKAKKYEQRLQRAYQLANLGWWEWNIHGEQINASDELYRIFGISKAEFPAFSTDTYLSLVYPDDFTLVVENIALLWKKPAHQFKHRVRKPDGEVIYVEVDVQTTYDENNNVIQVHGIVKDITAKRKYEEECSAFSQKLQQANHDLLRALESMSDGFFTTDKNWTITYMNHKAAAMLDIMEQESYIGKNLWACFPQAVDTKFYHEYHRAAAENTFVLIEEFYPPLNTWFEVSVYPHPNGLSFYLKDISQRKQQERELVLSNERFHLVAQATSEAIWDWNIAGQKIEWGEGFYTLFGYRLDEMKMNIDFVTGFIHPNDKERVMAAINKVISGNGKSWENEFRFRKADNSYAYVLDKGIVVRDGHGNAIRMVGALQDITEQKKQEKRLEFRAKATSEAIWERELHSDELFIDTRRFKELTGFEFPGPSISWSFWLGRIHPENVALMAESRQYAIEHGLDFYLNEYRFLKADGNWAYLKDRIYVIRNPEGDPVSLIGAAEDVTNQMLFEKALLESEESYRQLFNNAPLPTILFDEETLRILDANLAIIEEYGYSKKELLSKTVFDIHPLEERQRIIEAEKKLQPFTRNDRGVFQQVKKNGERILVEVSATQIQYKGKAVRLATANNITEKVRLQKQLIEEKVNYQKSITKTIIEAQEKERSEIGRELHDNVNQLLVAAKLYVENIRHVAEQKEYFIDQSIALLNRSIDETRRLSHALVAPAINEAGLKESLLGLMGMFREVKRFEVNAVFDFEEAEVEGGLGFTIYRILQECFSNTLKYANASVVTVVVRKHRKKLQLTYTDNGVGFMPSGAKKGIGLKNITSRAEAYKGKVKISAPPNGGFELNVTFPMNTRNGLENIGS